MSTSVFVSGATGFIASHTVKRLLAKGYSVVGSVRSAEKGEKLKKQLGSPNFTYEIVAELGAEGAFDDALRRHPEVTVFLHVASPFHFKITDVERDLMVPAVQGTKNALAAIKKHGSQIRHVVVTSSYVAVMTLEKNNDPSHTDTEKSWNPISWDEAKTAPNLGYFGSKKYAEKAAWDFVEKENPRFSLNTVCPVLVFGPQAFDSEIGPELNTSSEILNNLLKLAKDSGVPDINNAFIDVRDVARAHVEAFEKNLQNERLILFSGKFAGQDLLDTLRANFEGLRDQLPVGEPGTGRKATDETCEIDNSRTREVLGFPFIGLEQCVVESVGQILRARK